MANTAIDTFEDLARQCLEDSENWFPSIAHSVNHHTLSLAGEVGEFANLIKKLDRGSLDYDDGVVKLALDMELTDVFIYLLNLAALLNVNLVKSYWYKRQQNVERFAK